MHDWEHQLKEAFDMVHMEPELQQLAEETVRQIKPRPVSPARQWKTMAAALCIILLVLTGFGGYQFLKPVHVISIDINPSIELGINRFDRVVTVDAYNDAGAAVSDALSLWYLKSTDALDTILSSQTIQECLAGQEELTLTVVGNDLEKNALLLAELEASVGNLSKVDCHSADPSAVENAHQCGLSYGKYLAYLEALAQNPELTPEEAQNMTMQEIREISGHHQNHHGSSGNSGGEGTGTGNGNSHHNTQQETTQESPASQSGTAQGTTGNGHHGSQGKNHHKGKH